MARSIGGAHPPKPLMTIMKRDYVRMGFWLTLTYLLLYFIFTV